MSGIVISTRVSTRNDAGEYMALVEAGAEISVVKIAALVATEARERAPSGNTPNRHGIKLKDSIAVEQVSTTFARAIANAPHANLVEYDTVPHQISPGEGALSNPADTSRYRSGFFSREPVEHHGTTGQHFMREAAEAVRPSAPAIFRMHFP